MAKKIQVLNNSTGTKFGFGEREVKVSETMHISDAEHLASLYPNVYVKVIEVATTATTTEETKATKKA